MESLRINDVRVLVVPFDRVKTVSCAFLVKSGSAHEPDELAGISHFIEHVAFRGTERYDQFSLKYSVESVGGTLNAFTDRLATVYYVRVPEFHFEKTLDVLKEITFFPTFNEEDVEIERRVILEEYKMSLDDPPTRLFDTLVETVWPGPFGRAIIGRKETIEKITSEDLRSYHKKSYGNDNTAILLAGKVSDKELKRVEEVVEELGKRTAELWLPDDPIFNSVKSFYLKREDLEQVHVALVKPVPGRKSPEYHTLAVLNTALGSGMSSILFNEMREKEGFVYEISSQVYSLNGTGILVVYAALSPEKIEEFFQKLKKVLSDRSLFLRSFEYGKMRYLGKLEMLTDSPQGVLSFIMEGLIFGEEETPEGVMEKVKAVEKEDYEKLYEKIFPGEWSVFGIGPSQGEILRSYEFKVE